MTTARADLLTLASAVDKDGDTVPAVAAFGVGATLPAVAGDAPLVAADATLRRRYHVHALGGQLWVSFGAAPNAAAEPRGLLKDGDSVVILLEPTHSIRVAAVTLS